MVSWYLLSSYVAEPTIGSCLLAIYDLINGEKNVSDIILKYWKQYTYNALLGILFSGDLNSHF